MNKNNLVNLSKVSDKDLLGHFKKNKNTISSIVSPSTVWQGWLDRLNFLHTISIQELRLHCGFGYLLGSPIEKDLWRTSRLNALSKPSDEKVAFFKNIEYLVGKIPNDLRVDEPNPMRSLFSIQYEDIYVNTDTLRTQVDINNLYKLNLINSQLTIMEIGGGYGQLAMALLRSGRINKFLIVDFPETLHIVARWVKHIMPEIPVTLVESNTSGINDTEAGLVLIPNHTLFNKENFNDESIEVDLLINVNSFCEMTKEQVTGYLDHPNISFKKLYSNNRDRQFENNELNNLLTIFQSIGKVWPERKDYKMFKNHEKIFKKDKFVHIVTKEEDFESPCAITELYGFEGDEMPGI